VSICNRTLCLVLFGRTTSMRQRVRWQCVGPRIPDPYQMWMATMPIKPVLLS
jgi:hypothetical protein